MEPGEVHEHPLWKVGLRLRLRFDVDQEPNRLSAEPCANHQVHFMTLTVGHVREDLLVQELQRVPLQVRRQFRTEQFQEIGQERRQQFLEQAVMFHRAPRYQEWPPL
jgi:hypothetical protein